jgi:acetylornithine/succinyldiaminopimelate/putrescine aminotransferase
VRAQELCRKHGTILISDEIQTGLGRTGKMFGFQHWNLEPDIITLAKSLSGGYVPCGAIVARRAIYQKTFSRMDRCVVHSTTFGRNNLAMACGLASLEVIENEKLVENAARMGELLMQRIDFLRAKHSFIKEVRGKGLIIAIEFHGAVELKLKMGWKLLHKVDKVLFAQMVVTQMLSKHRILTQVAGHAMDVGEDPAAADHRRARGGSLRERVRRRADGMSQVPRTDVGYRAELRPRCAYFAQGAPRGRSLRRPKLPVFSETAGVPRDARLIG